MPKADDVSRRSIVFDIVSERTPRHVNSLLCRIPGLTAFSKTFIFRQNNITWLHEISRRGVYSLQCAVSARPDQSAGTKWCSISIKHPATVLIYHTTMITLQLLIAIISDHMITGTPKSQRGFTFVTYSPRRLRLLEFSCKFCCCFWKRGAPSNFAYVNSDPLFNPEGCDPFLLIHEQETKTNDWLLVHCLWKKVWPFQCNWSGTTILPGA